MNFLFRETYWAGILILAGLLLILRNVFKIDLPVMGIIIPVIIISWGVNILLGSSNSSKESTSFFSSHTSTVGRENSHYNVVFGKGHYDLRTVKPGDRGGLVTIDAVFASSQVLIDPNVPMRIKASSVFGSCRLPDGSMVSFGDRTYYTRAYRADSPYVDVKADVVFGDMRIIESTSGFDYNSTNSDSTNTEEDDD